MGMDGIRDVESLWQEFAIAVSVPVGGTQWREMRRSFYAGAFALLIELRRMDGPDDECVLQLQQWASELNRFFDGIAAGQR